MLNDHILKFLIIILLVVCPFFIWFTIGFVMFVLFKGANEMILLGTSLLISIWPITKFFKSLDD